MAWRRKRSIKSARWLAKERGLDGVKKANANPWNDPWKRRCRPEQRNQARAVHTSAKRTCKRRAKVWFKWKTVGAQKKDKQCKRSGRGPTWRLDGAKKKKNLSFRSRKVGHGKENEPRNNTSKKEVSDD